ncbi:alpha/beta hydrolase family protein [Mycobacterium sp. SMC-4]|uniref:alpha/beta hydrolase family protein n=1 Tax=Mycobacterium sp. SMC-4 TaxID=2857059 RepID=UPI003CFC43FA
MSPDATAFAHLVDDGGFPRAVQRFLRGWRASSSRDVELPVEGPVTRVMHSADGHWLACQVAPDGGTRTQIWVVTTDPDDRDARRIDYWPTGVEGTAELINWDGTLVAAILTGADGVGSSCLIDPADGTTTVLDRRSGGRLVDAWGGASLVRVGPRGYRELIMLRALTETALLPFDPGSTTDTGLILDDHSPRRLRSGPDGETTQLYHPARDYPHDSTEGYVRALIRSENGTEHARLLEVTVTADGVAYHVVAERPGYELDEFTVSDDLSTVALLWNLKGASELQILDLVDNTLHDPIPLPGGMVASELSISAGGNMLALTVEGPSKPPTVELVDPRTGEWEPIDREPSSGPVSGDPTLETVVARDGLEITGWLFRPPQGVPTIGAMLFLHGGPEGQGRPGYNEFFPGLLDAGIVVFLPNVRGSGGFGRTFMHADDREKRFAAIDDVADAAQFLVGNGHAPAGRVACCGWSYGGYLTQAALAFHPDEFAAGISICGMSDLNTWYRTTEQWIAAAAYPIYGHPVSDRDLLEELSPLPRAAAITAPLLLVHGLNDTNVPPTESQQMYDALVELGRHPSLLLFDDDGHEIDKRENRAVLLKEMTAWLSDAFDDAPDLVE